MTAEVQSTATAMPLSPRIIRACWRQKTAPNPGQNPRKSAPDPCLRACVFRRIRASTPEPCALPLWNKIRANHRIRAESAPIRESRLCGGLVQGELFLVMHGSSWWCGAIRGPRGPRGAGTSGAQGPQRVAVIFAPRRHSTFEVRRDSSTSSRGSWRLVSANKQQATAVHAAVCTYHTRTPPYPPSPLHTSLALLGKG
jgi:hypothetical protein